MVTRPGMKTAILLVVFAACAPDDGLPDGVSGSHALAVDAALTATLDGADGPSTSFVVTTGEVGDGSNVSDAEVEVYADASPLIVLAPDEHGIYSAQHAGYTGDYDLLVFRGSDSLEVNIAAPPPITLHAVAAGVGEPVTLGWDGADPSLSIIAAVQRDGETLPITDQAIGAHADRGSYVIPGLTFDQPGTYAITIQRTRVLGWADAYPCSADQCATLSSVRANTIDSATVTLSQ
jgi:hypothetical protein